MALAATTYSIYLDWGTVSWVWFQRSRSLLALAGAVLGYRSILLVVRAARIWALPYF
jgi:hypothetical protein